MIVSGEVDNGDPGWKVSVAVLLSMVPLIGLYLRAQRSVPLSTGVALLRQLFLGLCAAIALFGVVITFAYETSHQGARCPVLAVCLLAVAGAAWLVGTRMAPLLDGSSDVRLARTYRTRFHVRLACSGGVALMGFAAFFLMGGQLMFSTVSAASACALARAAPTRGQLRRDQARLSASGTSRSIIKVLDLAP